MPAITPTKGDAVGTSTSAMPVGSFRVEPVDVLRGVVMILMALDHTRDFLGVPGISPTDPAQTTVPLFFTRWITHFCAPVFFLLTGTGAYLALRRKSKRQLSQFLFTRGLWLIFLELTLFRCLGFQFNFDYHVTLLNVLWALGWAMIVLSALPHLPAWLITALGGAMICGHNLLDSIQSSNPLWSVLHCCNFVVRFPQHSVFVAYPLVPWIGVTAVGYSLGQVYAWTPQRRRAFLLRAGLVATGSFLILRGINAYGDPFSWSTQKSAAFTMLSFLNTNKYPPSLLFLLMTLGPALVFLWAVDGHTPRLLHPTLTFGRVPLCFFLLHIPFIHVIAVGVCYLRYQHVHWMFESSTMAQFPFTSPSGWGLSLPFVYMLWVCVVIALYPLCQWFADVKQRRRDPWLSYL
jgi:uncharacterized membrane protein